MFEVGKTYTDGQGYERKCIAVEGGYAYLTGVGPAYRWRLADGTSADLAPIYNITTPPERPVIPWYPGKSHPKDGREFLAKFCGSIITFKYLNGKCVSVWNHVGANPDYIDEWSPLPK